MSHTEYPHEGDVLNLLVVAGIVSNPPTDNYPDIAGALAAAIEEWERETGLVPFLKDANDVTVYYDPPGNMTGAGIYGTLRGDGRRLYLPDQDGSVFASITSVTVGVSPVSAGTLLTENRDYWTEPKNAALNNRPIEFVVFAGRQFGSPRSIVIVGKRGYPVVPDDAHRAITQMAAFFALPEAAALRTGGLVSWKDADVAENYGESPYHTLLEQWQAQHRRTLARYVIPTI